MPSANRDQFAELLVRNQRRLFAFIVTLLTNRDDAEDVFQSTCLILWKKWEEFDAQRDFFTWACGVAHYEVRNFLRRKRPCGQMLSEEVISRIAETRLKAESLLERRGGYLGQCLDKLTELQRRLVEQCYLGDQPIKSIAADMSITPAALTMRLQRIRKILFECIDLAAKEEPRNTP